MKLQTKILALIAPTIVLPMLTLVWVSYVQLRQIAEERTLGRMDALLDQMAIEARWALDVAGATVRVLSGHPLVHQYLRNESNEERSALFEPALLHLFAQHQRALPTRSAIQIVRHDEHATVRELTNPTGRLTGEAAAPSRIPAMVASVDDVYNMVMQNVDGDSVLVLMSKKIRLPGHSPGQVATAPESLPYLAVTLNMDFLRARLDGRRGENGVLLVTDGQGRVLLPPEDAHAALLMASRHSRDRLPVNLFQRLQLHAESRLPARVSLEGRTVVIQGRRLHGGLFVFACLFEGGLLDFSNEFGTAVAGITAVAIVGALSLVFFALRRLVIRPIGSLRAAARAIGHGNLCLDVPAASPDEIGDLARSLAEMGRNLHRSNEQIRHLAYHDNLTGLPNRLMFLEHLIRALAHAKRNAESLALLFLDVDNFKHVNDTLGHSLGDRLLRELSDRLSGCLRDDDYVARSAPDDPDDLVARLGGDEFIILLRSLNDPQEAGAVAQRIIETVSAPFVVGSQELYVGASVGIAVCPTDGAEPDELIKHADVAMYHAKEQGKNNYQYYSESMNAAALQRFALEGKLRRALTAGDLDLHYQPQIDTQSARIVAVEALVRWRDAELGEVPPRVFIPVAEDAGLSVAMGEWVLNKACRQNRHWQDAGLPKIPVAVNLSRGQATRQDLSRVVADVLRSTRLDPAYLDVELTEATIMSAEEQIIQTLNDIRSLGVSISMDDFGAGYSSLSFLRRFPVQKLKIERSFIHEVLDKDSDAAIISAIIAMGKALGLSVVAEGVETEEQLAFLRHQGCDAVQGFVYSPPVTAEEMTRMLRTSSNRSP